MLIPLPSFRYRAFSETQAAAGLERRDETLFGAQYPLAGPCAGMFPAAFPHKLPLLEGHLSRYRPLGIVRA